MVSAGEPMEVDPTINLEQEEGVNEDGPASPISQASQQNASALERVLRLLEAGRISERTGRHMVEAICAVQDPASTSKEPAVGWASVVRSTIASVGKFEVDGNITQWLAAFESHVELTIGKLESVEFSKLKGLLLQCCAPQVQQYLNSMPLIAGVYSELKGSLLAKYGKTARQVKFELQQLSQGPSESISTFFDRIDAIATQCGGVANEYLEALVVGRVRHEHRQQLASFEAAQGMSTAEGKVSDLSYPEIKNYLVCWERQMVSTLHSSQQNVTAAIASAREAEQHEWYGAQTGGQHGGYGWNGPGGYHNGGQQGSGGYNGGGYHGGPQGSGGYNGGNGSGRYQQRHRQSGPPRGQQGQKNPQGQQSQQPQSQQRLPQPPPPPPDTSQSGDSTRTAAAVNGTQTTAALFEELPHSGAMLGPDPSVPLSVCAKVAQQLDQVGVDCGALAKWLDDGSHLGDLVEDCTESLGREYGYSVAEEFANAILDEFVRVGAVSYERSPEIWEDDFVVDTKQGADGVARKVKRRIRGSTVKELARKARISLPASKLAAADPAYREYMLYSLITIQAMTGGRLVFPEWVPFKQLNETDWKYWGIRLGSQAADYFGKPVPEHQRTPPALKRPAEQPVHRESGGSSGVGDDEFMVDAPSRVQHLRQLFSAQQPAGQVGCQVVDVQIRGSVQPMSMAVDKVHLTPLFPGGHYLHVVLDGRKVRGLYDCGSNVTIISERLATELALPTRPYAGAFRQAAGAMGKFTGVLGPVLLQLHDAMVLKVEGIRVMSSADQSLQMVLGTDLFAAHAAKMREVQTETHGGARTVTIEVGAPGSGELFRLPMIQAGQSYAPVPQVRAMIEETPEFVLWVDPVESTCQAALKVLSEPTQFESIERMAKMEGLDGPDIILVTWQALVDGEPVDRLVCNTCGGSRWWTGLERLTWNTFASIVSR